MTILNGHCLCGGVAFTVSSEDLGALDLCHCRECRRWSGHAWEGLNAPVDALILTSERTLKWYRASPRARRGFCSECGASLFWHGDKLEAFKDRIGFSPAALEEPTGLTLKEHIFVSERGDYYQLNDGLPQKEKS